MGRGDCYAMSLEAPQVASQETCGMPSESRPTCKMLAPQFPHQLPSYRCFLMLPNIGAL